MGQVYVLRSGTEDLFKIGRTRQDVDSRIRGLATGNPHRLTVFDIIETEHDTLCETHLHRLLRSKRVAGEFFAATPAELRAALRDARDFLAEFVARRLEVKSLAEEESDGRLLTPGSEEWSLYTEILETRADQDHSSFRRELLENKLKLIIGKTDGLDGVATWRSQTRYQLDEASLRLERPDIFRAYQKGTRIRVFRLSWGPRDLW